MTIKEVEEKTGLARSSIRFYEKEKLIHPIKDTSNGYRDYTEKDVENIKKIAYLRTLGISIENIQEIVNHKIELQAIIEKQYKILSNQIEELENAKAICQKMMNAGDLTYDKLDIEAFVKEVKAHWESNQKLLRTDSVSFIYMWGGSLVWSVITVLSVLVAVLSYAVLPKQIPIQWNNGTVSNEAGKMFIFAYPAACIVIRFLLRPFIWKWLYEKFYCNDAMSDYVTNYICFTLLSVQIFTILFLNGFVKEISTVFAIDFVVFIGIILIGWKRMDMCRVK